MFEHYTFSVIRISNGCELRIENSVTTVTVQYLFLAYSTFDIRPDMTEKLLTGTLSLNTTNQPSTIAFRLDYVFVYNFMQSRNNYIFQ